MGRELNPDLFGHGEKAAEKPASTGLLDLELDFLPKGPALKQSSVPPVSDAEKQMTEKQMSELRSRIHRVESQLVQNQAQMAEITKMQNLRLERLHQAIARLEEMQTKSLRDLNEKYANLAGRLNERKMIESKVEELIDRHNQLVHSFEIRMKQTQKLISERDYQVMKAVAALEDVRK